MTELPCDNCGQTEFETREIVNFPIKELLGKNLCFKCFFQLTLGGLTMRADQSIKKRFSKKDGA